MWSVILMYLEKTRTRGMEGRGFFFFQFSFWLKLGNICIGQEQF